MLARTVTITIHATVIFFSFFNDIICVHTEQFGFYLSRNNNNSPNIPREHNTKDAREAVTTLSFILRRHKYVSSMGYFCPDFIR